MSDVVPWTVEGVDEELRECSAKLRRSISFKTRSALLERADRLLRRRSMLTRCADQGIELRDRQAPAPESAAA